MEKFFDFACVLPVFRSVDCQFGADTALGCVFMDFVYVNNGNLALSAISFDGYGYCRGSADQLVAMNTEDSAALMRIYRAGEVQDQTIVSALILKNIALNQHWIWKDALQESGLLEN